MKMLSMDKRWLGAVLAMALGSAALTTAVGPVATAAGADLRSLVVSYNEAKGKLKKVPGKQRAGFVESDLKPALLKIAKLESAESFSFLVKEFNASPPDLAAVIVEPILASKNEKALEVLLSGFSRRAVAVRKETLHALAKTKRELDSVERPLLAILKSEKTAEVSELLPPVLQKLDTVASATGLIAAVRSEKSGRGGGALAFNRAVVKALAATKNQEVKDWLASDAAFRRPTTERSRVLLELVGKLKLVEARPHVLKSLTHKDEGVAVAAIETLQRIGIDSDITAVAASLKKSSKRSISFKIQVLDVLAASGEEEAMRVVFEAARDGDVETRAIAMGSLGRQPKSEAALRAVLGGLTDSVFEVRNAALRSLGQFRLKHMIGALIDHLAAEKHEKLRLDSLKLLVRTTGKNMGLEVADWKNWWSLAKSSFEFPKDEEKHTSVKTYDLEYFGIEITSGSIAFLVDASSSMLQMVDVRKRPEKEKKGGSDDGDGPTRRAPPKPAPPEEKGGKKLKARKIDVLKRELVRVLEALPETVSVNIIFFHASYSSWKKKLQPLTGKGRAQAVSFVKNIRNGTGTNVYDTLEFTLKDRRVDTIYLLTDGQPSRGKYTDAPSILREIEAINRVRGATLNCIAFGEESDLLKKLAAKNGGQYRFVDSW